jgi:hypothetical protein
MKLIYTISLSLLLFSCFSKNSEKEEIDRLNQRITLLEQKMDALISGKNVNSIGPNNRSSSNTSSYSASQETGRCQAITKKGSQCKRKAKANGYCWQHGG